MMLPLPLLLLLLLPKRRPPCRPAAPRRRLPTPPLLLLLPADFLSKTRSSREDPRRQAAPPISPLPPLPCRRRRGSAPHKIKRYQPEDPKRIKTGLVQSRSPVTC